jgi:DNA mismatch endonuclease (patch repair protein)
MAAVHGRNTKPELQVRSLIHELGYRFRLHRRDLPGSPDVVLPRLGLCIFVHGCFWHRHAGCRGATTPKTRADFWAEKFKTNVARDLRNETLLCDLGWTPVVVWECETRDIPTLRSRLGDILGATPVLRQRKTPSVVTHGRAPKP